MSIKCNNCKKEIDMELSEEEKKMRENDILFQIDMQLYDEFNDTLATMNDHLGDIYSLRDIDEIEKAQKEKEIKLLREVVKSLQNTIKNQSYTNKKMRNKIKTVRKERNKLQKELDKKDICLKACEDNLIKERQLRIKQDKVIDLMAIDLQYINDELLDYYDKIPYAENKSTQEIKEYFLELAEEVEDE